MIILFLISFLDKDTTERKKETNGSQNNSNDSNNNNCLFSKRESPTNDDYIS